MTGLANQRPMNREERRAAKKASRSKVTFEQKVMKKMRDVSTFTSKIAMMRPYDAGPIIGDDSNIHLRAEESRDRSIRNVRSAFVRISEGTTDCPDDIVILAEAFGVSVVRSINIAGEDVDSNPLLQSLQGAQRALQAIAKRHEQWNKWQVTEPERLALDDAVTVYVEIITNSSPAQMESAMNARSRLIAQRKKSRTN